jgi:hypothetical protein
VPELPDDAVMSRRRIHAIRYRYVLQLIAVAIPVNRATVAAAARETRRSARFVPGAMCGRDAAAALISRP